VNRYHGGSGSEKKEGKKMNAEAIYDYLARRGFRAFRPQRDIWGPEGIDPQGWPIPGSVILTPTYALDELGYVLFDHFSVIQLVLRKVRGIYYWEARDRLPYHLNGFESAAWDAAHLAVVRSVPVTLRECDLWQVAYKYNRKYYMPD
jgi:hypothetical protein